MKMITVKILDTKLEAALLNHKVRRKFDEGIQEVVKKANEAITLPSQADGIEMQCNAVISFIDDIFGKGSAKKVFGEETDLLTCLEAFEQLTSLYTEQVDPLIKAFSERHKSNVQ